jgi:adenylate cyclase
MTGRRYQFETWTLDCATLQLVALTGTVALRPKTFEVLQYLVENPGRLVTREEILDAVWPGVTVTEESITQCVSEIRQALGDQPQRIIKTVPRRGYVFSVAVDTALSTQTDGRAEQSETPRQSVATGLAEKPFDGPSVAVLPFANLSSDTSQEYLSDGMTEDIISGLSLFSELAVIASNSSFSYKGRAVDVREVGAQLGVLYVVEGTVRRFGDRIRITAQLVDARSGIRRWNERFDAALGDVFAVQDEITRTIVSLVVAHLGKAEGERAATKLAGSWTAYDFLMRGEHELRIYERTWASPHLFEARRYFAEAHKIDPGSARIAAMLGHTFVRAFADPGIEDLGDASVLRLGYDLVSKAVGLDPNLPLARAQLAWALFWMHKPDLAVKEYEKAFSLNPNFSDWRYPVVLVYAGEAARALDVVQSILRLDPFHPPHTHAFHGHALYALGRYEEALPPLRECIRRGPHVVLGQVWLAATLVRLGQREEAKTIIAEVLKRVPLMTLDRWPAPRLYLHQRDSDHMVEALKEAGLP